LSGAYVRELLREMVEESLPVLSGADIDLGIKTLLETKQISPLHIKLSLLFSEGYTLDELKVYIPNAEELLISFFSLLSETIQYFDEIIVQIWLNRIQKRTPDIRQRWELRQMTQAYRDKIEEYSRKFDQIDLSDQIEEKE